MLQEATSGKTRNINLSKPIVPPFVQESWRNINAINDTIKEAFSITDKLVISVMRGNAGAGGAMAAMASDVVWAHENVILNPHYKVRAGVDSQNYLSLARASFHINHHFEAIHSSRGNEYARLLQ